jgi:hypothetical protein
VIIGSDIVIKIEEGKGIYEIEKLAVGWSYYTSRLYGGLLGDPQSSSEACISFISAAAPVDCGI